SDRSTAKTTRMTHSGTRGRVVCSPGRLTSAASRRNVCDCWQGELKAGAAGQVRARPQSAAVSFDDRTADRQAHPQTARFRGVESLEHALKSRRREAWTRISHSYEHVARVNLPAADEQLSRPVAGAAHSLHCIHDQIEDHLLQLYSVA